MGTKFPVMLWHSNDSMGIICVGVCVCVCVCVHVVGGGHTYRLLSVEDLTHGEGKQEIYPTHETVRSVALHTPLYSYALPPGLPSDDCMLCKTNLGELLPNATLV